MNLTRQRIVLTGGTSGIGLALLQALHERGNQLVVVGRDEQKLQELQQHYPDVAFLRCNLSSLTDITNLLLTLDRDFPEGFSVLINNAGVQHTYTIGDDPEGQSRIVSEIQTNLTSAIMLCDALLPMLKQQAEAAIINVTSGLGLSPKRTAPVYCATKAGLQIFSKALRYQLEGSSVRVVDVVLPLVDTPMTAGRGTNKMHPEQVADALIRGVEREQAVINVGKVKLFRLIHRLAPSLADRLLKNG